MDATLDQVVLLLDLAAVALPLTAALLLAFLPGQPEATRPRRLLAQFLAVEAAAFLPGVVALSARPGAEPALAHVADDLLWVAAACSGVFLASYPRAPRWRSAEGAACAAAVGFLGLGLLAQFPFHALDQDSLLARVVRFEGSGAALLVLFALAMRRARAAGEPAAPWVANAPLLGVWGLAGGHNVIHLALTAGTTRGTWLGLEEPAWDAWHVVPASWVAVWGLLFFAVLALELRARDRIPLVLIGLGVGADWLSRASGLDNWPWVAGVLGVLVIVGVVRHGAFGIRAVPRRAQGGVFVTLVTFVFLLVLSLALSVAATSPVGLALGIFAGLGLGLGVAAFTLPDLHLAGFTGAAGAAREALPPPGGRLAGRYRVEASLGAGGQGRVFLAEDERLRRQVVLKAGSAAAAKEARLMAQLDHPNIVRVNDVLDAADGPCIVMEYLPGGTLRARLGQGPLPLPDAVRVLDGVLAGLEAAHARGVVHGDVKPENVLFDAQGQAKLADFGSARPVAAGVTAQLAPSATLLYASPEQVRGQAPDPRSDLYAAGVLFHEMLTGKAIVATEGMDDFALREAILRKAAKLQLGGQPAAVERFVRRAVAKEPGKRFPSAASMRAALAEAQLAA